ncbi:MAG: AEC family transporter [Clostridia bacterium]|nr:AEC family transporter [Clostridia bacterium]
MSSFIFAIKAVLPIILMVALGYLIKRIGLVKQEHAKVLNKLVFRLFLPVMLFLNVYNIETIAGVGYGYIGYAVIAAIVNFFICIPIVIAITKQNERRGAILQSTFRSNYALIGIPLAESLFGLEGAAVATLLSAAIIPVFNLLAVISLSIFRKDSQKISVKKIIVDVVKNPLIISIFAGVFALVIRMLFIKYSISFRLSDIEPVFKVLEYLSSVATPLALLVLGIQFEFSAISVMKKEIIIGVLIRTVVVPVLGLGIAYFLFKDIFNGAHFATFVAVFATPVAVSSVPMVQEMDGDVALAGQLVIWTTLVSAFTVFIASFLLKSAGIF